MYNVGFLKDIRKNMETLLERKESYIKTKNNILKVQNEIIKLKEEANKIQDKNSEEYIKIKDEINQLAQNHKNLYEVLEMEAKRFNNILNNIIKNLKVNKNLTFPLIAHTINNNVQHFVVVLKVSNNNVYIMDPSYGLITKQKDEFNKSYTGVAILFKNHNPYLLNNVRPEVFRSRLFLNPV